MGRLSKRKLEQKDVKVIINLISKNKPIILLIDEKLKPHIKESFLYGSDMIELGDKLIINKKDISNIEFE